MSLSAIPVSQDMRRFVKKKAGEKDSTQREVVEEALKQTYESQELEENKN